MNRRSAVWVIMTCGGFIGYIIGWLVGISGAAEMGQNGLFIHVLAACVTTLMGLVGVGVFETLGDS